MALASLLAIILQLTIVVVRTYLVEDDLNRSYVTRQANALLAGLRIHPNGLVLESLGFRGSTWGSTPTSTLSAFWARTVASFAHTTAKGSLSSCHPGMKRPPGHKISGSWISKRKRNCMLPVACAKHWVTATFRGIEVATFGDPANTYLGIVAAEVADDVWFPMAPLVLLTLGVATLSVRRSPSALVRAAAQAGTIFPLDKSSRLDVSEMPREAASLVIAINGLLDRVGDLVKSQRLFIARAAHELRTPLAIIMLELGRIDDPRVRRLEEDVRSMSGSVDRLLALARLESAETIEVVDLDMGLVASEVVDRFPDLGSAKLSID